MQEGESGTRKSREPKEVEQGVRGVVVFILGISFFESATGGRYIKSGSDFIT